MELEDLEPVHFIVQEDLLTIDGKSIRVGRNAEKPTLLTFFMVNCQSCNDAAIALSAHFNKDSEELNVVAVGRDHEANDIIKWAEEVGLDFELVADPNRVLYNKFAKIYVPRIYIIDVDGTVLYQDVNWHPLMLEDIEDAILNLVDQEKGNNIA